jgi:2,3-bisphosphoglycerate-dependent phosphoglycerate mutase
LQLLMIRHGESEADLLGVHEGRADFPLTEHGRQQARLLAKYLKEHFPPDVILASPLKRANGTAEILREKVNCPLVIEADLMEYNNGVLAGMSREEAALKYPEPKNGRPIHIPIENGESELAFRFRAEHILHKILHEYKEYNRVAIVSHGGMISNLLKSFLKMPNGTGYAFPTGDTGIHLLEIRDELRVVRFMNRQEHLSKEVR